MGRTYGKNGRRKTSNEMRCPERADRECNGRTALKETCKNGWRWRTTATDRRSWRLLIVYVVREN